MASTTQQIKDIARTSAETCEMIGRVGTGNTDRLHLLAGLRRDIEQMERFTVNEARTCNWTWQDVGDALGISRQAAQQRFGN